MASHWTSSGSLPSVSSFIGWFRWFLNCEGRACPQALLHLAFPAYLFFAALMASEPIQYFNRYSGRLETEDVYGDQFLRWAYGNPLGRLSLHALVKRAAFSRWYGRRMDAPSSRAKVAPFISTYHVRADEFADAPDSYRTFNQFFYRKLKAGARPIDSDPTAAVFPADGRHLGFTDVSQLEGIFVKGAVFDVRKLLA